MIPGLNTEHNQAQSSAETKENLREKVVVVEVTVDCLEM